MRVERSTPTQVRERILELKRKKNNPQVAESLEERIKRLQEQSIERKKALKMERIEKKRKEAERIAMEAESRIDKECAEVMGFGEFGGS